MSIRFKQNAGVLVGSDPSASVDHAQASVSFNVRFNTPNVAVADTSFFRTSKLVVGTHDWNVANGTVGINVSWYGTTDYPSALVSVKLGVAHHVAITYDKDDVTQQAMYVDGVKTLMGHTLTTSLGTAGTQIQLGQNSGDAATVLDCNVDDAFSLVGYTLTQDDVLALRDGADPSTIGVSATSRVYAPIDGTVGATPTNSDPGIQDSIGTPFPATVYIGGSAGDSEVYDDPIPYVNPIGHGEFFVTSTGRHIQVNFNTLVGNDPAVMASGGVGTLPTITINGGAPITLLSPLATTAYAGMLFKLPGSTTINPGDVVAITTVNGWAVTSVGGALFGTDLPVNNRAQKSLYSDLIPPTMRVGMNSGVKAADWHPARGMKNLATRCQIRADTVQRSDQTVGSDALLVFLNTSFPNEIDDTCNPELLGLYAIQYDDTGADPVGAPTTLTIEGYTKIDIPCVVEQTAYSNPGVGGVGKGAVYSVDVYTGSITLAASCTSTDTVLTLTSMTEVVNPNDYGSYVQWIKVDDEYCKIQSINIPSSQITVVRGEFGSTPAAHANSATGIIRAYRRYPQVAIRFSKPSDNQPTYSNLVVYGPGDFTLPSPAGPIDLDRSTAYSRSPTQYLQDAMVNSLGVIRQMDSTDGGYGRSCEPEHMRLDSDLFPGYCTKFSVGGKIAKTEPATAAAAPYMYTPYMIQGAATYPVTLAADITTAPAAGTVETITITADPANPVFYPLRLEMPSTEIVRILTVTGDQSTAGTALTVEVVRGAERTTPATQAAGTIQARYRVAAASDAVYQIPGKVLSQWTTDQPHNLWNRVLAVFPTSSDLNPLARFNVTLTADVTSTDELVTAGNTFSVSVDPANAQYLVQGLIIVFDSEAVYVNSYDSTAGTISVRRHYVNSGPGRINTNPQPAALHTAGTVGTASSGGSFLVSDDGTRHAWGYQAGYTSGVIVTGPNTFIMAQAVENTGTHVWYQVGTQVFSRIVDDSTAGVNTGGPDWVYSYDWAARFVALAPGADMWLNIPDTSNNDLVDAIATAVRDGLPAGQHRVLVELGNEFWNYANARLDSANQVGYVCQYADKADVLIQRGSDVTDRIRAVFEDHGRGSEVKFVVAWQQGGIPYMITRATALGLNTKVDVYSTAPYFLPAVTTELNAAYEAATDDECLDIYKFDLEDNIANIAGAMHSDGKAIQTEKANTGRNIEFICYEGGFDSMVPVPFSTGITDSLQRNLDLNYNPYAYLAMYDTAYIHKRRGWCDGIAHYRHITAPSWNGPTGSWSLWGINEFHGQIPGRGDGSDGKHDNRLTLARPGQPNTKPGYVSQAETNVSVRMQGLLDYNAAYSAYDPSPGPASPQTGSVFFLGL